MLIMPVYFSNVDRANQVAYARTKATHRYWTAVPYKEGWIISDRYHPQAKEV